MAETSPRKPAATPQRSAATLRQRVVGFGLSIATKALRHSPAWLAYGIADCLTPILVFATNRRERRIAPLGRGLIRNQRIACRGTWNPSSSRTHLRRWAKHMTHTFVDFCRMPSIQAHNLADIVDLEEFERLRELQAEGKGLICASGHVGIWEMCGHVISLSGLRTVSVSRPSKNPAIETVLRRIRTSGGQQIIQQRQVLWPLLKALKRGELIGIAADEDASSSHSAFSPFLGTLAATSTTSAMLAQRTGSPIAVVSCQRIGRGRYRAHVWDVVRVADTMQNERDDDEGCAITNRISRALSRAIETYPEQWLWGSRRFATRPRDEALDVDGLPPRFESWSGELVLPAESA